MESKFKPGDHCDVNVCSDQYLHAKVVAVKFTKNKVLYDLDVQVDIPTESGIGIEHSRFHGVRESLLYDLGKKQSLDVTPKVFQQAFKMTEFPPEQKELPGSSDDVLVDVDGRRKNTSFIIAYYDFDNKKWRSYVDAVDLSIEDLSEMRWMYLPMAHYEK